MFTAGEQEFYAERGFQNEPQRCKSCRDAPQERRPCPREYFTAVCAACGGEAKVPLNRRATAPCTAASASRRCVRTAELGCSAPRPALLACDTARSSVFCGVHAAKTDFILFAAPSRALCETFHCQRYSRAKGLPGQSGAGLCCYKFSSASTSPRRWPARPSARRARRRCRERR